MSTSGNKCIYPGCTSTDKALRRGLCRRHRGATPVYGEQKAAPVVPSPANAIETDLRVRRLQTQLGEVSGRYRKSLETIEHLETSLGVLNTLKEYSSPFAITPQVKGSTNEATPILVASDWHMEQRVRAEATNGKNEYTLEIASQRASQFFSAGLRLIRLLNQDVAIKTVVLALLGDFITGELHGAENAAKNQLPPTEAIVFAQNHLASGIDFLLNHSTYKYNFIVVCKVGNHSRTTEKSRIGNELGYSYEYLMYLFLRDRYKNETRIAFIIEESFNSYVKVYDETFRFNHGHTIKYQGGIGGLFIPAYKKIDKWDQAQPATRTVIGHHHTFLDGGNFHCNGSLIGYDERAAGEGYAYEPPMQTLLLVDRKRGQTCKWPVFVERGKS